MSSTASGSSLASAPSQRTASADAGERIAEVASVEKPRLHRESTLRAVSDGFQTLRTEHQRVRALRDLEVAQDLRHPALAESRGDGVHAAA